MTVSDEIVLSMTAIMTAFASGENRSMLNQPFPNGKARMAVKPESVAPPFPRGKARSRNAQARSRAPLAESLPLRARRAPVSETRHVFQLLSREDRVARPRDVVAADRAEAVSVSARPPDLRTDGRA
ncbi:hypothetical protein [Burkholderia sp. Bp9143]|uniref:hypothetical protein n=1 Tax=Burkholderia sp. Bp9143 TaxID=2184574 RepID=UPI0021AB281B|nr:hypothetical protein [Burkholderia sp. Bp9143]